MASFGIPRENLLPKDAVFEESDFFWRICENLQKLLMAMSLMKTILILKFIKTLTRLNVVSQTHSFEYCSF
jgi:hypothetical protein